MGGAHYCWQSLGLLKLFMGSRCKAIIVGISSLRMALNSANMRVWYTKCFYIVIEIEKDLPRSGEVANPRLPTARGAVEMSQVRSSRSPSVDFCFLSFIFPHSLHQYILTTNRYSTPTNTSTSLSTLLYIKIRPSFITSLLQTPSHINNGSTRPNDPRRTP